MAVIRFELDLSPLDDALYGLGGPSGPAFVLDTSLLDGTDVLDGSPFLVLGVASSSLGGLVASADGTVIVVTVTGVATANLGGLVASATTKTKKSAIATANLGGLVASATTKTSKFSIASSDLGGITASATAVVIPPSAPPSPNGGRRNYPPTRRKKIEPFEPNYEPVPITPKVRYAVCSAVLGSVKSQATGSITFSILDDDAEILLMV